MNDSDDFDLLPTLRLVADLLPMQERMAIRQDVRRLSRQFLDQEKERRQFQERFERVRLERDRLQLALSGVFHLAFEPGLPRFCEQSLELIARLTGSEVGLLALWPAERAPVTDLTVYYRRCEENDQASLLQELFASDGLLRQVHEQGRPQILTVQDLPPRLQAVYAQRFVKSLICFPFLPSPEGVSRALLYLEHCSRPDAYGSELPQLEQWIHFVSLRILREQEQTPRVLPEDQTVSYRQGDAYPELVGRGRVMAELLQVLELFRRQPLHSPVALVGEPGTGRETFAGVLHRISPRRHQPLVVLRADLEPNPSLGQLNSLLERATRGTLYLSDAELLSLSAQRQLIRSINERRFFRGSKDNRGAGDLRLLLSTRRPLSVLVREGVLEEALAAHVAHFELNIPPLRNRREDIRVLADHFMLQLCRERRTAPLISGRAMEVLERAPWPGNLTQLRSSLDEALVRCHGPCIEPQHLALDAQPLSTPDLSGQLPSWKDGHAHFQRQLLTLAMQQSEGKVVDAARKLKVSRQHVNTRLKLLGLQHLRRGGDDDEGELEAEPADE